MIGDIGIVHIRPKAHGTGEFLPHSLIFPHALLTFVDKGSKAVFLDLLLAVQSQKLLHLQFHRQAMGVPPRLPGHHIPLHGAVPGDHILDGPGLHMADVGFAVGRGRAVIEGVDRTLLPALHALPEDVLLPPEFFHLFFTFYRADISCNLFIHTCFLPFPCCRGASDAELNCPWLLYDSPRRTCFVTVTSESLSRGEFIPTRRGSVLCFSRRLPDARRHTLYTGLRNKTGSAL